MASQGGNSAWRRSGDDPGTRRNHSLRRMPADWRVAKPAQGCCRNRRRRGTTRAQRVRRRCVAQDRHRTGQRHRRTRAAARHGWRSPEMSDPALGLLMLCLIVVVIMMGFPTAFTLMGLGIVFGFMAYFKSGQVWWENGVFDLMVQRTYGAMTNDVLISIPLFVLMGYVMERGALVDKMFYSIQLAFRRVPASLAVATLIVCTFWGIASGLVGAVVVLMGVIAFNPMLRAGYDVKLASGVITAGGPLGILIPPSVMIIVYAAVAGQSVVKLYAAAMLPGFFLALLYMVYIVGWAMIQPKIAPPLSEELTRVPVPAWLQKFQSAYSKNMLVGLISALFSPSRATAIEADKERISYWTLFKNLCGALVPVALVGGWWGVAGVVGVLQAGAGAGGGGWGQPAAGSPRPGPPPRSPRRTRPAGRLLLLVWAVRCRRDVDDRALLLANGRRSLRGSEASYLVRDAAEYSHRRRSRCHSVRNHDGDRIRRHRRCRRFPAGFAGADARLETHQGSGVSNGEDHCHGVLAVRRLGAIFWSVRDPRGTGAGRAMGAVPQHVARAVHDPVAGDHLPARMAARMDGDHTHLCSDLPSAAQSFQHRPDLVGHAGVREPAGGIPVAAGCDVGVLPQGGLAAARHAQSDLQRHDALHGRHHRLHGDHVPVARDDALAAELSLRRRLRQVSDKRALARQASRELTVMEKSAATSALEQSYGRRRADGADRDRSRSGNRRRRRFGRGLRPRLSRP